MVSLDDQHIRVWDVDLASPSAVVRSQSELESRSLHTFHAGKWNPHQNCNQVATAVDTAVKGWDLRNMEYALVPCLSIICVRVCACLCLSVYLSVHPLVCVHGHFCLFVCFCLSIQWFLGLFVHIPVCLFFVCPSIDLCACPCLSVFCLSIHRFVCMSLFVCILSVHSLICVHVHVCLFVCFCLSIHWFLCLSVHVPVCLFFCLSIH